MACCGTRRSHLIGVDIVVLAVRAKRQRRQNWNPSLLPKRLNPARLGKTNLTNKSQIVSTHVFPACAERHSISTAESNGRHTGSLDGSNQFLVHHAAQHHERYIASLGVSDA